MSDNILSFDVKLRDGDTLPRIGMGTFGSDKYTADQVASAVDFAIRNGWRMFDCASVYGNEKQIGVIFANAISNGVVKRDDLYITSKVWNDMHGQGDVLLSLAKTLKDLQLDYVDAYFVHWPFPNYHSPGAEGDARDAHAQPFSVDHFMSVWRQMERVKQMGLVRHIGMSNMTTGKLETVLPFCREKPDLIEMELHPSFQQPALFDYCRREGIQVIAFCPIGSPARPERDRTADDIVDTEIPEIVAIANAHRVHPAIICLKWSAQMGAIPIPFSTNPRNIEANLKAVFDDPLTDEEMATIAGVDRDCRLIKGQVFLWEGATDWRDIWE